MNLLLFDYCLLGRSDMTELRLRRKGGGVIKKKIVLEIGSLPPNSLVCTICTQNTCEQELEQFYWRANCTVNSAGYQVKTFLSDTRTSTRSEAFSLLICLDATKFLFLSVFFSNRDDLPENLVNITFKDCKKSTSVWHSSLKNVVS